MAADGPELIEIASPRAADCPPSALPPEGNVKLRGYRLLSETVRAYSPTGDVRGRAAPGADELVPRYETCAALAPPRARLLALLRPEDPGRDALEAIVRPAAAARAPRQRRALARPLDDDARRFLQRALLSPSPPQSVSAPPTPEQMSRAERESPRPEERSRAPESPTTKAEWSLADELREAERHERMGDKSREPLQEPRFQDEGFRESEARDWMGKLALSMEEDEEECEDGGLAGAARRLDALLAESRDLHLELAGIQRDLQVLAGRLVRRPPPPR